MFAGDGDSHPHIAAVWKRYGVRRRSMQGRTGVVPAAQFCKINGRILENQNPPNFECLNSPAYWPVPVSETFCGPVISGSPMLKVPVWVPVTVGLKASVNVQLELAGTLPPLPCT